MPSLLVLLFALLLLPLLLPLTPLLHRLLPAREVLSRPCGFEGQGYVVQRHTVWEGVHCGIQGDTGKSVGSERSRVLLLQGLKVRYECNCGEFSFLDPTKSATCC